MGVKRRLSSTSRSSADADAPDSSAAIWPAPQRDLESARAFIQEAARSQRKIVIAPDRDADGLCSGAQLRHTLLHLGAAPDQIAIKFVAKGRNVHCDEERADLERYQAEYIFVLDHGSRGGGPIADGKVLILDHHWSEDFPDDAQVVSACKYLPVATASLLTYVVCLAINEHLPAWLAVTGTVGDLGTTVTFEPPFPTSLAQTFKAQGKKQIAEVVALLNAPRRTPACDPTEAWQLLIASASARDFLASPSTRSLDDARVYIQRETERCTHAAPRFTKDGRMAILEMSSPAQIHQLIATRWAGFLKSKALLAVGVANRGYAPDKVHLSCRLVKSRRSEEPPVNLIALLNEYLARDADLAKTIGPDFAHGHKEAAGGHMSPEQWDRLVAAMEIGNWKSPNKDSPKKPSVDAKQSNLTGYFKRV